MDNMEEKLNSILGNPQMMSQIMSMAQTLGQSQGQPPPPDPPSQAQQIPDLPHQGNSSSTPGIDTEMLRKIFTATQQTGIDKNQQGLLKALGPYLSRGRIMKLEKAMRAAKIAGFAASALGSTGKGR